MQGEWGPATAVQWTHADDMQPHVEEEEFGRVWSGSGSGAGGGEWSGALPAEGHVKLRNYRRLQCGVRAYTPSGDVHTSPAKRKLVPRYEAGGALGAPRERLLRLLRPADRALAAVLRPARRAHAARLPPDAHTFLQRALLSPSPPATPDPRARSPAASPPMSRSPTPEPLVPPLHAPRIVVTAARSLADELREADGGARDAAHLAVPQFNLGSGWREAVERERMARLAASADDDDVASVEEEEEEQPAPAISPPPAPEEDDEDQQESPDAALRRAGRRLDALLREARALHGELAAAQRDLQSQSARACRCAEAARALVEEAHSLRYMDDLVALLRGDIPAAAIAKDWPFVQERRISGRNYVV